MRKSICVLLIAAFLHFIGTPAWAADFPAEDYPAFQEEFYRKSTLGGVLGLEDTALADLQPEGFATIEEAKEKIVEIVEAEDWLAFRDYIAPEGIIEAFYLYDDAEGMDFATVFTEAIAKKFFAYGDMERDFSLSLREEADMLEIQRYTLVYDNALYEEYPLFFFLEKREERWYWLADSKMGSYRLYELWQKPGYTALREKMEAEGDEYSAVVLYTMFDINGCMTPAIYLSKAPDVARFLFETESEKIEYKAEDMKSEGGVLLRAGNIVSREPFSEIRSLTMVNSKGEKFAYTLR